MAKDENIDPKHTVANTTFYSRKSAPFHLGKKHEVAKKMKKHHYMDKHSIAEYKADAIREK